MQWHDYRGRESNASCICSVAVSFPSFFVPRVNQTPTTSQPPKPHSQCFRYPDGGTVVWTCCRRNIALPADWLKAWLVCVEMILTLGSNPFNHLTILWFLDLTNTHWPHGCPAKTTAFWILVNRYSALASLRGILCSMVKEGYAAWFSIRLIWSGNIIDSSAQYVKSLCTHESLNAMVLGP